MKILLTGGIGFIGFHTAKALLSRGDELVIVDNFNDYYDVKLKKAREKELKKLKNKKLQIIKADISDFSEMKKIFSKNKFDKICHLAAQAGVRYSIENPFIYEESNILGTLVMLEMARHYEVKDFVYASSSSVYGNNKKTPFSEEDKTDYPVSLYAATKKSCEMIAHSYHSLYKINCTGLRFFTVYGPFGRPDMAYYKFSEKILEGKPIEVYAGGELKRDFTYVDDIVTGVIAAIDKPFSYEIINLGNNKPITVNKLIAELEKNLNKKADKKMIPPQAGDVNVTFADITKAKKLLGWKPTTTIEEGIKKFVEWYEEYC
jgi:UDP-glucuronate 4-epimerase